MSENRFTLSRDLGSGRDETLVWVMLNPSTADETFDDPTIRRVKGFTAREGYRHLMVVNLFAQRSTKPKHLLSLTRDEQEPNLAVIRAAIDDAAGVVAAWGATVPSWMAYAALRAQGVIQYTALAVGVEPLLCLGKTRAGHPRHPLYVRADQPLEAY